MPCSEFFRTMLQRRAGSHARSDNLRASRSREGRLDDPRVVARDLVHGGSEEDPEIAAPKPYAARAAIGDRGIAVGFDGCPRRRIQPNHERR